MRWIIRLLLLVAALLLVSPFLISSLLVDQRGILIPGHVVSKDEYITVDYSSWTRHLEAGVQYEPPDDDSATFLKARVGEEHFDALRKGDVVQLRYLPRKDLPNWPGFKTMREMRVLPSVRLASERTGTGLAADINQHGHALAAVLAIAVVLLRWRWLRLTLLLWAVVACVLVGLAFSYVETFPRPTRAPHEGLRTAAGTVKSIEHWKELFRSAQDRSAIRWIADQPIAVAGIEFVPEGRTAPVVAVDLIDDGSLPGLVEHSAVNVDYESASPRVAYIQGATRRFAERNLKGLAWQLIDMLIVTVVLLSIVKFFGWTYRKLTRQAVR